jgi:phosphatidylglycerol:prolipoprotein diacylglycerol transferase
MLWAEPHLVHQFQPVIFEAWGVGLYYYGLAYSLGLLGVFGWLRLRGNELGWSLGHVYDFVIILAVSILIFGRAFEVVVYEWGYYKTHLSELFRYWRGGMASHGVLLGGVVGVWLFSRLRKKSFLALADEIVIPAAFFLAIGRIGNFINGEIVGTVTDVSWAVKFPDVEGFRHPVALYESLKNFLIIPILLFVRRYSYSGEGKLMSHFVIWYGFLRLFSDYFRDYGTSYLGIGTGQYFNLLMSLLGLTLLVWFSRVRHAPRVPGALGSYASAGQAQAAGDETAHAMNLTLKRLLLVSLLILYLLIPSSWTQGVLKQYRDHQLSSIPQLSSILPAIEGRLHGRAPRGLRPPGRAVL